MLLISLWLHLTLLLLLVVTVHYDRREEELPPPSTVAMVFEGGKPEGPGAAKSATERCRTDSNLRRLCPGAAAVATRVPPHRSRRRHRPESRSHRHRPRPSRSDPRSAASAAGTAPAARGDR